MSIIERVYVAFFPLETSLSPLYPAYEMQQRESVLAFAVDNQQYSANKTSLK